MRFFIGAVLALWCAFFLANKIDLTTADLGRHLKNGELVLQNKALLFSNFYSYTHPDFPFVNHHWASGLIFHLIKEAFGFRILSLFYLLLGVAAFLFFYDLARRKAPLAIAVFLACLTIPLVAQRTEIRPEGFSYFFAGLFFWLLTLWRDRSLKNWWLWILPICEVLWVNCHIYFFFGPMLIGLFLAEEISFHPLPRGERDGVRADKKVHLTVIFLAVCLATLINPFGIRAALFPVQIFANYGYKIVENQSVWFLERLKFYAPNFLIFKIVFGLLAASFLLVFIRNRKNFPTGHFFLGLMLSVIGWLALRNFTLFGFFALPLLAENFGLLLGPFVIPAKATLSVAKAGIQAWTPAYAGVTEQGVSYRSVKYLNIIVCLLALVIALSSANRHGRWPLFSGNGLSLGLKDGTNDAAQFFLEENIKGPIFNNYDIGSYLIYHLFPKERVFVDNRPEAYPAAFFKEVYVPMQENLDAWRKLDAQYGFNAIFFSHRDATPWGQQFLIERVNDSNWAPVFANRFAVIFLKRNTLNTALIEKFELPKDRFRVIRLK